MLEISDKDSIADIIKCSVSRYQHAEVKIESFKEE
jgi:hypothetical protein